MAVRRRRNPDWTRLHSSLEDTYAASGSLRMLSTVRNFRDRKERICRRLGVVCEADVARIAAELKRAKTAGPGK